MDSKNHLTAEQALAEIRATATKAVPNCVNLDAIDRIMAKVQPATPAAGAAAEADFGGPDANRMLDKRLKARYGFAEDAPLPWQNLTPKAVREEAIICIGGLLGRIGRMQMRLDAAAVPATPAAPAAAEAGGAAWVPVEQWPKKHHEVVEVLYQLHKGWVNRQAYWDDMNSVWRSNNVAGNAIMREVHYVTHIPRLPALPASPTALDTRQ